MDESVKTDAQYQDELREANEAVYKHSLELARLSQELVEANARQETLIHFIGHEVKGFLTKAEGAFAALLEGDFGALPEPLRPFVTEALKQTRDGVTSVSDILTASNLKKGTTEYKQEPFDLQPLVAEAVEAVRPAAGKKGLALSYEPGEGQYVVAGDRQEMSEHVLRNLLDNAVNYTPAGSIRVTLARRKNVLRGTDAAVLTVADTGVGISAEDTPRLFTEGGHGADSQKVNVHSTGYGLFIAKLVVEAHCGTIRAESEGRGKGATFVVELPIQSGTVSA